MRWLTLPIGADQAGKPVSTLLRRELGLSAAGVRRGFYRHPPDDAVVMTLAL